MGWEDRPYYRDRGASSNRAMAILNGSVPLFTAFGIRVRAHSSFFIFALGTILLDWSDGFPFRVRAATMTLLFGIVLLHEFGHCFAGRWVGGTAERIMLTFFGGLAFPDIPHRPAAHFWTVAGGPLVNVGICLVSGVAVWFLTPTHWMLSGGHHLLVSFNPFHPGAPAGLWWDTPALYCWWIFSISYILLLFNLLPSYPLDGGQLLQAILWNFVGYYRSMMIATIVGMCGAGALALMGLFVHELYPVFLAAWLFYTCYQRRVFVRETGPTEPWQSDPMDFSASLYTGEKPKKRRRNTRAIRIARKRVRDEIAQRERIDAILAKVSAHGLHSLSWTEKHALRKATELQRKRDLELQE